MSGLALLVLTYGVGCLGIGLWLGCVVGVQRMAWRRGPRAE